MDAVSADGQLTILILTWRLPLMHPALLSGMKRYPSSYDCNLSQAAFRQDNQHVAIALYKHTHLDVYVDVCTDYFIQSWNSLVKYVGARFSKWHLPFLC